MLAHVSTVGLPFGVDAQALVIAAALTLLSGLALVAVAIQRRASARGEVPFGTWTALVAAALSLGAGAIHFTVIDDHADYLPYGAAFVALASFQAGWGLAVLRRDAMANGRFIVAAVLVNTGVLATWTLSRFVGLPFGPHAGELEPVGSLDVAAGALELALVGLLIWVLTSEGDRPRLSLGSGRAFGVVGSVVTAVVVVTSGAFASAIDQSHDPAAHQLPTPGPIAQVTFPPAREPIIVGPGPSREQTNVRTPGPPAGVGAAPVRPLEPTTEPSLAPVSASPSAGAPSGPAAEPTSRPSGTPSITPKPTATPRPTRPPATPVPKAQPGAVRFGNNFDASGEIGSGDNRFEPGETAVWIADLREAPGTGEVRLMIIQVLPDGREFEHWREQVPLSDPSSTRLAGTADLSIYVHGGEGTYRLRYYRGEELLAEGAFEFIG